MATGVSSTHSADEVKENIHACCSPCKEYDRNTRARHYCVDCEMYFCLKCLKDHNKFPSLKSHQVNDVQSADTTDTDDSVQSEEATLVLPEALRCTLHQGKHIDTYCKEHNEVCCGICAVVKHRSCSLQSTAVAAKDFKSNPEVNKCSQELTELLGQLKQEKEKRTENMDHIEKEKLKLINNVDNYQEQIISKVKSLADSTRGAIRSKYEDHKADLDKDVGALDAVIANTELYRDKLEVVDDEILFGNVKMSKTVTNDATTILQAMTTDWRKKELYFNYDKKLEKLVEGMKSFGHIHVYDDSQFEDESSGTKYIATFQKHVIVQQDTDSEINGVLDMCKLDSGALLLADYYNNKLKRFNMGLHFIDEISLSGQPIAVCKTNKEEVAVRIWNTKVVHLISVGQSMQLKTSFTLDGDGRGMTYDTSTGEILVCEEDRISVYSTSGIKLRTYDSNTNGEQLFSSCRQIVFCEKQQQVYVADEAKGLVVLDKNGTFITCVAVDIKRAWPLCVLPGGVCLVGSVHGGAFVQILGDRNQVGKIINGIDGQPYTYCVLYDHEHSRLIIGGKPNICVYTLSRHLSE